MINKSGAQSQKLLKSNNFSQKFYLQFHVHLIIFQIKHSIQTLTRVCIYISNDDYGWQNIRTKKLYLCEHEYIIFQYVANVIWKPNIYLNNYQWFQSIKISFIEFAEYSGTIVFTRYYSTASSVWFSIVEIAVHDNNGKSSVKTCSANSIW